jgi:hypothetical protein
MTEKYETFGENRDIEGRIEQPTRDLLKDIIEKSEVKELKDFAALLLERSDLIDNSTILRGETTDGVGFGATNLYGSLEDGVNPQVYINETELKHTSPFLLEPARLEENPEKFHEAICHELAHSFTRYIISAQSRGWTDRLNEIENQFYDEIKVLFDDYMKEHQTKDKYLDTVDEFIARSLTSIEYIQGKYYQRAFEIFKKLYLSNDRKIVSLSKKIK